MTLDFSIDTSWIRTTFNVTRGCPDDSFLVVRGDIEVYDDYHEDFLKIGDTHGIWFPKWYGAPSDDFLHELDCEAHDLGEMAAITHLCFEEDQDDLSCAFFSSWLGIRMIRLDKHWRGIDISYIVMQEWLNSFGADAFVIAQVTHKEPKRSKLLKHWKNFGFTIVEETQKKTWDGLEGIICRTDLRWTPGSWLEDVQKQSSNECTRIQVVSDDDYEFGPYSPKISLVLKTQKQELDRTSLTTTSPVSLKNGDLWFPGCEHKK